MDRDLVGYADKPPQIKWPNGARLAVSVVVNYEEGAEHSILRGDQYSEQVGELSIFNIGNRLEVRDVANESMYEYGSRVGIWRLLNLFDTYNIKITIFGVAKALELNKSVAREFIARGHEICGHGYYWHEHYLFKDKDEERTSIRAASELIKKITGERIVGWYCREPSDRTTEILAEMGFMYASDAYNDDVPYFAPAKDKILVVPYSIDNNDFHYFTNRWSTNASFFEYLKDSFDTLYKESESHPKMMSIGLHARISGLPGRIGAVKNFLEYATKFGDVWFCKRADLADWWLRHSKSKE